MLSGNLNKGDVNIHNFDSGTGIRDQAESVSLTLCTEQEATLDSILAAVGGANIDVALSSRASELTLSTRATEATQLLIKTNTDNLDVPLSDLKTQLLLIESHTDSIRGDVASLDVALSSRASEVTLALANATLSNIQGDTGNLDIALSTRATEATLVLVKDKTNNLDIPLSDLTLGTQLPAALTMGGNLKVAVLEALPAGTNVIGHVIVDSSALPTGAAGEHVTAVSPHAVRLTDGAAFYKATTPNDVQPISLPGVVSTGNSSTTPLLAAGTFVGTFEEVTDYSFLTLSVFSDQVSAVDGLAFQWSSDGTNVDRTELTTVLANVGRAFSIAVRARFFRIAYTNGATPQGTFRLGTVYHKVGSGFITKTLKASVNDDNFAQLVQAPTMGRKSDGTFENIKTDTDLRLYTKDMASSIAIGAAIPANAMLTGGKDASGNLQPTLISSVSGKQQVVASSQVVEDVLLNKAYSVSIDSFNLPTGATETDIALFRNPGASTKKLVILGAIFDTLTGAGRVSFRVYTAPTVTSAGTSATTVSRHLGGGAAASQATAFSGPTIAVRGSKFTGPVSVSGTANALQVPVEGTIVLEPGQDLLLTGVPDANNRVVGITLIWEEI